MAALKNAKQKYNRERSENNRLGRSRPFRDRLGFKACVSPHDLGIIIELR
jgi:hypothetical protein